MPDLIVRRYKSVDKEQVKELYKLASIHSEIGYRSGPWENDLDNIEKTYFDGGEFLIGLINDNIVALGGYRKITNMMGHVRRMRVHPDYRRKGYAQQILQRLEKEAKKNKLDELRLRTSKQQIMAQNFYEKNGFKKMKTKKEFYTEGGWKLFEVIWYRKILI